MMIVAVVYSRTAKSAGANGGAACTDSLQETLGCEAGGVELKSKGQSLEIFACQVWVGRCSSISRTRVTRVLGGADTRH